MRLNPEKRFVDRLERMRALGWHRWYAWYPKQLSDGTIIWREYIERKVYDPPLPEKYRGWRIHPYFGSGTGYIYFEYRRLHTEDVKEEPILPRPVHG